MLFRKPPTKQAIKDNAFLAEDMSGKSSNRRGGVRRLASLFVLTLLLMGNAEGKIVPLDHRFDEPVSSGIGGRTVLVEEITATWCPSCAQIDPELLMVADSHASRIALVALHPSDGEDAFQPEASQHRIDRLKGGDAGLGNSTPTFVVEGGEPRLGYDAWPDVQKDILDAELQRQSVSELAFEVVKTETGYKATLTHAQLVDNVSGQLTFLLLEHGKPMPQGVVNPGEATRDRVVVAAAECVLVNDTIVTTIGFGSTTIGQSCTDGFSVEFETLESWSVVLLHEATTETVQNQGNVPSFGAVELAFRDRAEEPEASSFEGALLLACGVLALVGLWRKK